MSDYLYCLMSVAGPLTVVTDFHATLTRARTLRAESGWRWKFGLCNTDGVMPVVNDPAVKVENRPPGESYVLIHGIWHGRDWTANNVCLAINTMSSLWPELTISFAGEPYESYRGVRGLWTDGQCIVLDFRVDEDNPDYNSNGEPITSYRQVHPSERHPIPLFYQYDFTNSDSPPSWDELREEIAAMSTRRTLEVGKDSQLEANDGEPQ